VTLSLGTSRRQLAGTPAAYFVVGWCSFGVALGVGVLIGWLIWGY